MFHPKEKFYEGWNKNSSENFNGAQNLPILFHPHSKNMGVEQTRFWKRELMEKAMQKTCGIEL